MVSFISQCMYFGLSHYAHIPAGIFASLPGGYQQCQAPVRREMVNQMAMGREIGELYKAQVNSPKKWEINVFERGGKVRSQEERIFGNIWVNWLLQCTFSTCSLLGSFLDIYIKLSHLFSLGSASHKFHESVKHFNLVKSFPSLALAFPSFTTSSSSTLLIPPHSLLPFPPLAAFTNTMMMLFNDLQAGAPIAIATADVSRELDRVLQNTVHDLL